MKHLEKTHEKTDDTSVFCPDHTVIIKGTMRYKSKKGPKLRNSTQNKIYDECGDADIKNAEGKKVDPALKFYYGVPLMINSNKRIKERLANGTCCYGMYVVLRKNCNFTPECWDGYMVNTVQASDVAYIICKREKKNKNDLDEYFKLKAQTGEVTVTFRDILKVQLSGISMEQFPLNSNIATTCHKLQGKTLVHLIVNSFNYGKKNWVYVVLSRIKELNGLILRQKLDNTKDFSCDPFLLRWEKKMKDTVERQTFEQRGLLTEYLEEERKYCSGVLDKT